MESGGGNKKTTCFVMLLVLAATVLFVLYAATGRISRSTSVTTHAVRKVHSIISDTLTAHGWGLADSTIPDVLSDYEDLIQNSNSSYSNTESRQISEDFAKLFPMRSIEKLNDSINMIKGLLYPYYKQIENTAKALNKSRPFSLNVKRKFEVANGYKSDYFDVIGKHSIKTLYLSANRTFVEKVFDYNFFDYTSNNCDRVEKKSIYGKGQGLDLYNITCQSRVENSLRPRPLQDASLGVSLPQGFMQHEDSTVLTFLHVIQNAFVKSSGDIYADGLKIVPQRCNQDLTDKPPDSASFNAAHVYDEVLTISQFWGGGFFHATVEQLTRIAPYIPFLQENPQVKIHVESKQGFVSDLLRHVGLDSDRLISGHIKAKILYATAGSACARPGVFNTHLMSLWYRTHIKTPPEPRDSIVVVRRSPGKRRWFTHHDQIYRMVQKLGKERGLRVELFGDHPVPPLKRTLEMFSRAFLIIAPHGAGLSNMFFTEPGTVIIEGLCYDAGRANLCYRNLAQLLGQRWFGVLLEEQCMNMLPVHLETPLRFYLDTFVPKKSQE